MDPQVIGFAVDQVKGFASVWNTSLKSKSTLSFNLGAWLVCPLTCLSTKSANKRYIPEPLFNGVLSRVEKSKHLFGSSATTSCVEFVYGADRRFKATSYFGTGSGENKARALSHTLLAMEDEATFSLADSQLGMNIAMESIIEYGIMSEEARECSKTAPNLHILVEKTFYSTDRISVEFIKQRESVYQKDLLEKPIAYSIFVRLIKDKTDELDANAKTVASSLITSALSVLGFGPGGPVPILRPCSEGRTPK